MTLLFIALANAGRLLTEWSERQLELEDRRIVDRFEALAARHPTITAPLLEEA